MVNAYQSVCFTTHADKFSTGLPTPTQLSWLGLKSESYKSHFETETEYNYTFHAPFLLFGLGLICVINNGI